MFQKREALHHKLSNCKYKKCLFELLKLSQSVWQIELILLVEYYHDDNSDTNKQETMYYSNIVWKIMNLLLITINNFLY